MKQKKGDGILHDFRELLYLPKFPAQLPAKASVIKDRSVLRKFLIETSYTNFLSDRNAILALKVFLFSLEMGVYPPAPVMNFIKDKLDIFFRHGGESLDRAFGFVKHGQRKDSSPLGKLRLSIRDHVIAREMLCLTHLKISVQAAAGMVYKYFIAHAVGKSISIPTVSTIIKIHHKMKFYNDAEYVEIITAPFKKKGGREKYLRIYQMRSKA